MTYTITDSRPDSFMGDNPMYHYCITLHYSDKSYMLWYSVGIGHSKVFSDIKIWHKVFSDIKIRHKYFYMLHGLEYIYDSLKSKYHNNIRAFPWHLNYDKPFFKQAFALGEKYLEPLELKNILYSIMSDCLSVEKAFTFEDFCNEFGYDSDSRKAYKIWEACKEQNEKFKAFAGRELYEHLTEKYENGELE